MLQMLVGGIEIVCRSEDLDSYVVDFWNLSKDALFEPPHPA